MAKKVKEETLNLDIYFSNADILKTQRRGDIKYLPFVTTLESIIE